MTKAKEYPTMAEAYGMTEKELQAHLWEEQLALDREYLLAKAKHEADIMRDREKEWRWTPVAYVEPMMVSIRQAR